MKIIFRKTNGIIQTLIRIYTRSQWNHVGIILEDGRILESLDKKGVRITDIEEFKKSAKKWEVAEIQGNQNLALAQLGKPYDYSCLNIFRSRKTKWLDDKSWYCSELVAYASGLFRENVNLISPEDIYKVSKSIEE